MRNEKGEKELKKSGWTMRKAIMVFCVGCVMAALLMQTFLFQQSLKRQIRTESIADNENTLTKMQAELTTFIHNIRTEMLTIYSEYDLIEELRAVAQEKQEQVPANGYWWRAWYLGRKRFSSEDRLMAMYLYDSKNQLVSAYRYNCQMFPRDIYKSEYDANTERVLEYVNGERTDLMISGYYNPLEERDIIRFVLKLHNYDEERKKIGYLVCEIDSMAFAKIMNKYVDLSHVYLWMQPVNDRTIVVTGEANDDQRRIQKQLSRVIQNYYDSSTMEQEYGDYYLIHVGQAENNLEACALVSQSLLTATQRSLNRSLLVIMSMMLAFVVVFVMFLSRWLTRPTEQMLETIERIKNGETQLRVQPVGWSEELKVLGTEFNDMLDRVQAMAQEEYKYRLLVERTEYKMLQAQINPHFLYNTLNTMSGIANAQNCPLVSGLCHSLSAVFRYSLNMTDEFSTVQKEMEHVKNYLYVMDVRSGSDVAYEYHIAEETLQDQLPRICLQPIVENAITHGLRNVRRKDKKLTISAMHENGLLVIWVEDNGTGMDAEEMNRLLEKNDPKRVETGVSIGILNVNARLKRVFGEEYGILIDSRMGEGTKVSIRVPILEKKEQEGESYEPYGKNQSTCC